MRRSSDLTPPLLALAASAILAGCTVPEPGDEEPIIDDPNAGLLRDFLDGKFDSAGHPLNARVTEVEALCPQAGVPHNGAIRISTLPCQGAIAGSEQHGDLVASLGRIREVRARRARDQK